MYYLLEVAEFHYRSANMHSLEDISEVEASESERRVLYAAELVTKGTQNSAYCATLFRRNARRNNSSKLKRKKQDKVSS